jgi:outer membrane protein assembly factor BamE (lipoprotein component of BamABCDE complex)
MHRSIISIVLLLASCMPPIQYGRVISDAQATLIKVGMTMEQVEAAIGAPQSRITKRNDGTTRWIYASMHVTSSESQSTQFIVDFGKDGRVSTEPDRLDIR